MYIENILIAFYSMLGIIIFLSTIAYVLVFLTDYRDFSIDFRNGILIRELKLSRLNLDLIPNKIHEFDNGFVKVISASLVLVRRKLSSETIASVGRRVPMVYCSIELVSGVWEAKIKISYVSVILLLYPLFFFGIISFNFISVLKFHPLSFVLLLIPFGVVSFLYSIIEAEAVDQMYKIFAEFSEIVS